MKKRNLIIILTVIIGIVLLFIFSYFFLFKNLNFNTKKINTTESKTVSINIKVDNSNNAEIFIDGTYVGKGEIKADLKEGVHILKAYDPIKGEYNESILINADSSENKKIISLAPIKRAFTIQTDLPNCTLFLDNEKIMTFDKTFSLMIPMGIHEIKIKSPGYNDFIKEVEINDKFAEVLSIKLTKE